MNKDRMKAIYAAKHAFRVWDTYAVKCAGVVINPQAEEFVYRTPGYGYTVILHLSGAVLRVYAHD